MEAPPQDIPHQLILRMPAGGPNPKPLWSASLECARHWRVFLCVSLAATIIAIIVARSIPTTYTAKMKISDEHKDTDLLLGLNAFASWAKSAMSDHEGLRLPEVYYQLVTAREFAEEMSHVRVESRGTDYYHYIASEHREPWWEKMFGTRLNEHDRVIGIINENIRSKVSSRYGTIQLFVSDQDPVVAAMLVDSVRAHLQNHMAGHARERAIRDMLLAQTEMEQAEQRYKKAREDFAHFEDTHQDITSGKFASMEDHLLKEYETTFNDYSKQEMQYRRAKALVGKFSYTFAVVQNVTVPNKASAPFASGYIMSFLFVANVVAAWYILLRRTIKEGKEES